MQSLLSIDVVMLAREETQRRDFTQHTQALLMETYHTLQSALFFILAIASLVLYLSRAGPRVSAQARLDKLHCPICFTRVTEITS